IGHAASSDLGSEESPLRAPPARRGWRIDRGGRSSAPDRSRRAHRGRRRRDAGVDPCGASLRDRAVDSAQAAQVGDELAGSASTRTRLTMRAYLDSSVLLRVVLGERGRLVEWSRITAAVTSEVTRVECLRALDRLRVAGALAERELARRRATAIDLLKGLD